MEYCGINCIINNEDDDEIFISQTEIISQRKLLELQ